MRKILCTLTVALCPIASVAHEVPDAPTHALVVPGAFDSVPPRAEYYGHFLRGQVHHGAAHHGDGHLNAEALFPRHGQIFTTDKGNGFIILVTPNLVNHASARHTADHLSVAHCKAIPGATRVTYHRVERHARQQLDAWMFQGRCR
ncbi:hypothetical protein [Oceaniglobus ichthyenteri]|uniref:hypothetical protein n=1 Tax=Oceaniglobus ichthyenteri TaxID=2136177 RepID=UPI000D3CE102|nr:hypothetical protein [Oceaniglobus ichthyenteri]